MKLALTAFCVWLGLLTPVLAEDRVTLGWGRMFANDGLGDGRDRWRTGAYAVSLVRGVTWSGRLPTAVGALVEVRLRGEVISPENLQNPALGDRRYAGALTFGVHSQFEVGGFEADVGGDLVFVGPQTGVGDFQSWLHGALGLREIRALDAQIDDAVYPTLSGEIGRRVLLGTRGEVRPFVAARAGDETWLRAGADLVFGGFGRADLMLRDVGTGQRFLGVAGTVRRGVSAVIGGDIAHVFDSRYLPDGGAVTLRETRRRLRAGVQWQNDRASAFYGVTYLSPEFEEQHEGQLVGAMTLNLRF